MKTAPSWARKILREEEWLKYHGVALNVVLDQSIIRMMTDFIAERPDLWNEDVGV